MELARRTFAALVIVAIFAGASMAAGGLYGFYYGSRDKVCAEFPHSSGASIVVCDYAFEIPAEEFVR